MWTFIIAFASLLITDIFLVIYGVISKKQGILFGLLLILYPLREAIRYLFEQYIL